MTKAEGRPARVRFAPSPTGYLHIGGARAALFNYLLARQTGGQFILRIEDTDRKRYQPDSEQDLMESLRWLGLEWDEGPDKGGPVGPYRQSERAELYRRYAEELVERGHAYYCFCSPERLRRLREERRKQGLPPRYDGHCRNIPPEEAKRRVEAGEPHVIRFKAPREGEVIAHDLIRGPIRVANKDLDDFILLKSDGMPTYHLAVVVDDHLMGITHVLRGAEWLSTFPLHVHLYRAFGWEEPVWVHLSLFLKPSGKGKISKRDVAAFRKGHKSVLIRDLREFGYLPEAVNNWLALMGWSYDDRTEFFTMQDLIEKFSLERLKPSPAAVNFDKLDHFQGLHVRALPPEELARRLVPFFHKAGYTQVTEDDLRPIVPLIQTRIVTLDDAVRLAGFFFEDQVEPNPDELVPKGLTPEQALEVARRALAVLEALPDMKASTTEPALRALVDELGLKARHVFGLIRVAVTGQRVSPPLFETLELVGRDKVLERMRRAIALLEDKVQQSPASS
ncbi:MAG: glutamate--tRNA ligase [Chloroflexi bacterium]|nr:glutamate--tRNA ligase [Chloroflexota bacterium]